MPYKAFLPKKTNQKSVPQASTRHILISAAVSAY
jgi:hypothetical protein